MDYRFSRSEPLLGAENIDKLRNTHIVVAGLGGVGGYVVDTFGRLGIGELTLIDYDVVSESNINRQLIALQSTIGTKKTLLYKKRLKDINPDIKVNIIDGFYSECMNNVIFGNKKINFVVDTIDTVKSKIELLTYCHKNKINIITSLGAGNVSDPTKFIIKDIGQITKTKSNFTNNILRILKKKGINSGITAVYSDISPIKMNRNNESKDTVTLSNGEAVTFTKITPASLPYVVAVAGYYMSYSVIQSILLKN